MKKLFKLSFLALFLLSFAFQSSYSEPGKLGIGLTGGYLNASNDVHYVYSCDFKKSMDNFNQGGYFAGIVMEYPLGLGLGSSIITRLHFNSFSYNYYVDGASYPSLVDDGNGGYKTIYEHSNWDRAGNNSLLSLDLLPKIVIPFLKLGVFAGISVSYLIHNDYSEIYRLPSLFPLSYPQTQELINKGYRISYEENAIYYKEGEIPYKNNFRYAMKAGLTYDFNFWGMRLSPFLTMDFPLSDVVNGVNMACSINALSYRLDAHWRITYYQAGIDLKYLF
jgi:hypothetical protein